MRVERETGSNRATRERDWLGAPDSLSASPPYLLTSLFGTLVVHEFGHSFGLEHCATPGCIMHDGEGSVRTTDTEHDLCPDTRARLEKAGLLRGVAKSPFI
jgi:hypothetical protein